MFILLFADGGVLKVTLDTGSDGCEDCRLQILIYNPKVPTCHIIMLWWYHVTFQETSCYFFTDYDRISASTNYQWTDESLNYDSISGCDAWMEGNPTAGGWRLRIAYITNNSGDTLRLSTGEVFFLSDDGSGARLSCPMDDHLFGSYDYEYFDCYWTMWCCFQIVFYILIFINWQQ